METWQDWAGLLLVIGLVPALPGVPWFLWWCDRRRKAAVLGAVARLDLREVEPGRFAGELAGTSLSLYSGWKTVEAGNAVAPVMQVLARAELPTPLPHRLELRRPSCLRRFDRCRLSRVRCPLGRRRSRGRQSSAGVRSRRRRLEPGRRKVG